MIKRAFLILLCLIFMIFHADLVTKGAVSGLLLWYSSVVPALFPFMVLSSVLSRLRRGPGTHASVPGNLPLCRTVGGRLVCSPHRSSLRLPHGSKDMCRSLRGRADQLRGGEISLCTLQSSKSHVSRRFRLSHVCFPGPVVIFCLFSIYAPLLLLAVPASLIYRREHVRTSFPASITAKAQTKQFPRSLSTPRS